MPRVSGSFVSFENAAQTPPVMAALVARSVRRTLTALLSLFVVVAAMLVSSRTANAQTLKLPAPAPSRIATNDKAEEEATDSPRVSMRNFLDLAARGRYEEASIYLDLPRGTDKRGADLTSKLYAVLSQRLLINPDQLSPLAQGRPSDGLPSGVEELGKISDSQGHPVAIRLVRHDSRALDDEPRWVFAQSTVSHVEALYASLRDRWIRDHLPASLLTHGPLDLAYWQWLALPLLAVVCVAGGRVLGFLTGVLAKRLLSTYRWSSRLLAELARPVTLAWAIECFVLTMPTLALTLRAEDLIDRGIRALAYTAFFWGLLRMVAVIGDELTLGEWTHSRPSARALSSVGVSLGKVIVAALALMVALTELGYPVTSVIAGLGIGGVALALAAQKTVENLFGSISILFDQPFRVGDVIRVDSIEGMVERIGLRSTRVRTAERTVVIFPNGKLADMRIESLGARDKIRFSTKLELSRSTTPAVVIAVVAGVKERLEAHRSVRKEDVFVRLTGIGEDSYDIEVAAPVETLDPLEFARVREQLLVACIEVVEKAGATLAVPTRQLVGAEIDHHEKNTRL